MADEEKPEPPKLNADIFRVGSGIQAPLLLLLLVVRGLAMWIYVPLTVAAWLLLAPVRLFRRKPHPTLRLYITAIDGYFIWGFLRTILRPFTKPVPSPEWPKPGDTRPLTRLTDAW